MSLSPAIFIPLIVYAAIGIFYYLLNRHQNRSIVSFRGDVNPNKIMMFHPKQQWFCCLACGYLFILIFIIGIFLFEGGGSSEDIIIIAVGIFVVGIPVFFEAIKLRTCRVTLHPDRIVFKNLCNINEERFTDVVNFHFYDGSLVIDCGRIPRLVIPLCFDNPRLIAEIESRIRIAQTTTTSAKLPAS